MAAFSPIVPGDRVISIDGRRLDGTGGAGVGGGPNEGALAEALESAAAAIASQGAAVEWAFSRAATGPGGHRAGCVADGEFGHELQFHPAAGGFGVAICVTPAGQQLDHLLGPATPLLS